MYLRYLVEDIFAILRKSFLEHQRVRVAVVAVLFISFYGLIRVFWGVDRQTRPVAVKGMVRYRGAPVEGARVLFIPHNTRPSSATTDAHGCFKLGTFSPSDGAMVGEHSVCISKAIVEESDAKSHSPYKKPKSLLPIVYGTPMTSPLKAHVTLRGPNEFTFDLQD